MSKTSNHLHSFDALSIIDKRLQNFEFDPKSAPTGRVARSGDGIALVQGLTDVMMGEIVEFPGQLMGVALNLNQNDTGCILFDDPNAIKQGDLVKTTGTLLSIPVSDHFLGRVVNVLGQPLDGKGQINAKDRYPLEKVAPGVMTRKSVDTPLQTGVKAVDAMIPIGRGQRELIIGDRSTGKSSIALSTIINQRNNDVVCIYVAIGQKRAFISQIQALLESYSAMHNTIIVSASASDPAAQQFIAPYSGTALAEYFLDQGRDVVVVYDDLSKHAWAYREISLLLRRPSGREAYPGDVFYLHSRLLERSCRLNEKYGGGSITALPIIETQANDVSAYIPTNVISITDGQIYLESDLFNSGQRPAINVGLSVSRVGNSAQTKAMKQVASKLRLELAQYRALAAFAQFSSDLDAKTKAQIDRGARLTELLKQHWKDPKSVADQVLSVWAGTSGKLDSVRLDSVKLWESAYLEHMHQHHPTLVAQIETGDKMPDDLLNQLHQVTDAFTNHHSEWLLTAESNQ